MAVVGLLIGLAMYNWSYLTLPPSWDAAMTVYPAAIELAESNFDLPRLLAMPSYSQGGPNLHAVSLVTWLAAASFKVFGYEISTYVFLHLVHLAAAAVGLLALYEFGRQEMSRLTAVLVVAVIALWPLVMRQFGDIYLETPLFCLAALTSLAAVRNQWNRVALFLALAVCIKLSGVLLALAVGLYVVTDHSTRWTDGLSRLAAVLAPCATVTIVILAVTETGEWAGGPEILLESALYLRLMPLTLALLVAIVLTVAIRIRRRLGWQGRPAIRLCAAALLAFVAFYVLLAIGGSGVPVVPRYYMLFIPFGVVVVVETASELSGKLAIGVASATIPLLILAQTGVLFPLDDYPSAPFAERFDSGPEIVGLHREQIRMANETTDGSPIYYWRYTHYLSSYPELGFTEEPLRDGTYIARRSDLPPDDELPPKFRLLYDLRALGGEVLDDLRTRMESDPRRVVQIREIQSGRFTTEFVTVYMADT